MSNEATNPASCKADVSGSLLSIFKEIPFIIEQINKSEIDTLADVHRELISFNYDLSLKLNSFFKGKLIVNGFVISQVKNSDGNYLPPIFLQWQAEDLFSGTIFMGRTKKECIIWSENYR